MAWAYVILAGCCEVVGVAGMNGVARKRDLRSAILLLAGFAASFTLLNLSFRTLDMGVAYAVWTGIGAAGSTVVGMFFLGESKDLKRIFFISLIIAGVVGLKLIS